MPGRFGTLQISLAGSYQPPVGTTFTVAHATTNRTETLAHITNPTRKIFTPAYTTTGATIQRSS